MAANPLYTYINGELMLSAEGTALALGIPVEKLKAEWQRQKDLGIAETSFFLPVGWQRQGVRLRKEVQAALGYDAGLLECIEYLAAQPGLPLGGDS